MQRIWLTLVLTTTALGACIANAPEGIIRQSNSGEGGSFDGSSSSASSVATGPENTDPHAVLGATPPHGPFNGGQTVIIYGKGFDTDVKIWLGNQEANDVVAIDPTRAQITTPSAEPGIVSIHAQNGDDTSTLRTLDAAYTYDALYTQPDTGPVAGGTVIDIYGLNTNWDSAVEARIDQVPCTTLDVIGPEQIQCTVPKGTPGTKSVSVTSGTDTITALDAYTYQDSSDGYKGGLSGQTLSGQMKVLVYNDFTGDPIPGAHVILGTDLSTGMYQQVGPSGVAVFNDFSLHSPVTVTAAARCHSPISFVDVPVDTVTVYLEPVLSPPCASEGDPPPIGGNPILAGHVQGELVWEGGQEFKKAGWNNVPGPQNAYEKRIAYVFFATHKASKEFVIPSSSQWVDQDSPGTAGYGFSVISYPGNQTMYAVAGLINTQTGAFSAYAFGAVQGVAVFPGEVTKSIVIPMTAPLDQALTTTATPPPPGAKGPDRVHATVAIEIAQGRYAILPRMQKTPLIPLSGGINFVGLPPLDKGLTGSRYIAHVSAVSGPSLGTPLSIVANAATTTTSQGLDIGGFVSIPALTIPEPNGPWDGRNLSAAFAIGGLPPDLSVYDISSGGGLMRWTVAVPTADHSITLPDLSGFELAGLPPGPVLVGVYGARIENFDYGSLRYRNLRPSGMDAHALDYFNSHL